MSTARSQACSISSRAREAAERARRQAGLVTYWVGIKTFDEPGRYSLADPLTGPCLYSPLEFQRGVSYL